MVSRSSSSRLRGQQSEPELVNRADVVFSSTGYSCAWTYSLEANASISICNSYVLRVILKLEEWNQ